MSLHLKLLDIDHPLTFEENKLRQIEAHALIYLRLPRTNFLKNSFSYNGAVIWNSLSPELRQVKSLKSFWNGCRDFFDWIDKTYTASM